MNRAEYMAQLARLLGDVPKAEREEALQYYNDYFDDAGVEEESGVIASLGSPEELARTIKAGLNDGGSAGEFTEAGFSGYGQTHKDEVMQVPPGAGYQNAFTGSRGTGAGYQNGNPGDQSAGAGSAAAGDRKECGSWNYWRYMAYRNAIRIFNWKISISCCPRGISWAMWDRTARASPRRSI